LIRAFKLPEAVLLKSRLRIQAVPKNLPTKPSIVSDCASISESNVLSSVKRTKAMLAKIEAMKRNPPVRLSLV